MEGVKSKRGERGEGVLLCSGRGNFVSFFSFLVLLFFCSKLLNATIVSSASLSFSTSKHDSISLSLTSAHAEKQTDKKVSSLRDELQLVPEFEKRLQTVLLLLPGQRKHSCRSDESCR